MTRKLQTVWIAIHLKTPANVSFSALGQAFAENASRHYEVLGRPKTSLGGTGDNDGRIRDFEIWLRVSRPEGDEGDTACLRRAERVAHAVADLLPLGAGDCESALYDHKNAYALRDGSPEDLSIADLEFEI